MQKTSCLLKKSNTNYQRVKNNLPDDVQLVAVSKTHPGEKIMEVYSLGQRIFR